MSHVVRKCEYNHDVIINKCLGLKDLKEQQKYVFFYGLWYETLVLFLSMWV